MIRLARYANTEGPLYRYDLCYLKDGDERFICIFADDDNNHIEPIKKLIDQAKNLGAIEILTLPLLGKSWENIPIPEEFLK